MKAREKKKGGVQSLQNAAKKTNDVDSVFCFFHHKKAPKKKKTHTEDTKTIKFPRRLITSCQTHCVHCGLSWTPGRRQCTSPRSRN